MEQAQSVAILAGIAEVFHDPHAALAAVAIVYLLCIHQARGRYQGSDGSSVDVDLGGDRAAPMDNPKPQEGKKPAPQVPRNRRRR